jgi:hypothetical protein
LVFVWIRFSVFVSDKRRQEWAIRIAKDKSKQKDRQTKVQIEKRDSRYRKQKKRMTSRHTHREENPP